MCQIHAGSLPQFFRQQWQAFKTHNGYLTADPGRVSAWRRQQLHEGPPLDSSALRGAAACRTRGARFRSIPLSDFARLLHVPNTEFVSLQHDDDGRGARELANAAGAPVHSFPSALADLDETAALIKSLDCVVTVCSSVVHLAGALATPTLVLTPRIPEWRYLAAGATMPWYPAVRLIRQSGLTEPGPEPIDRARSELSSMASKNPA